VSAQSYTTQKEVGSYKSSIYDPIIFQKVRDSFGGRVRILGSGSAPISAETHMFMKSIMCCPLIEGYGSTESTAGFLFSRGEDFHYGVLGSISVDFA
jgi:long-chain acyl-CoA synthetase